MPPPSRADRAEAPEARAPRTSAPHRCAPRTGAQAGPHPGAVPRTPGNQRTPDQATAHCPPRTAAAAPWPSPTRAPGHPAKPQSARRPAPRKRERRTQRRCLRRRQPVKAVQHRPEDLVEPRKGQLRLRLDPHPAEHRESRCPLDRVPKQRRLPDPRLAPNHEHPAEPGARLREQAVDHRRLGAAAGKHTSTINGRPLQPARACPVRNSGSAHSIQRPAQIQSPSGPGSLRVTITILSGGVKPDFNPGRSDQPRRGSRSACTGSPPPDARPEASHPSGALCAFMEEPTAPTGGPRKSMTSAPSPVREPQRAPATIGPRSSVRRLGHRPPTERRNRRCGSRARLGVAVRKARTSRSSARSRRGGHRGARRPAIQRAGPRRRGQRVTRPAKIRGGRACTVAR